MATSPALPYQPYQAPTATNPIGFNNTNDPRKIAANQRQLVQGGGDALMANDANLANQYGQQASGVEQYLNPIEDTLATGGGGFNQDEQSLINLSPELRNQMLLSQGDKSQIELSPADKAKIQLSPEDKQGIITGAGISAGANTAAGVGAAERSAAAAGGNPSALATYRARAAQTQGAQAGDAMTQARIAAKQAESQGAATAQGLQSQGAATAQGLQAQGAQGAQGAQSQGAQTIGTARMGQQQQGLNYYGGLQSQKAGQSVAEQGLQQGAYGTQVGGTGQAAQTGVAASQTPTTMDKVMGGIGGFLSALEDGTASYMNDGGMDAVVGENGPELIVEHASDPVRSHTQFMADGGFQNTDDPGAPGMTPAPAMTAAPVPAWKQAVTKALQPKPVTPAATPTAAAPQWNKTTPYSQLGAGLASIGQKVYNHYNPPKPTGTPAPAASAPTPAAPTSAPAPDSSVFGQAAPYSMMADGGFQNTDDPGASGMTPAPAMTAAPVPAWKQVLTKALQPKPTAPTAAPGAAPQWNKTTPYSQLGAGLASIGQKVYNHYNPAKPPVTTTPASSAPTPAAPTSAPAPDASVFGQAAPYSMMADGSAGDTSSTILNDYLGSAEADALKPPPQASAQQPEQGGSTGSSSSLGKGVGNVAKLAALAFLSDGRAGYRARPTMMADGSDSASVPGPGRSQRHAPAAAQDAERQMLDAAKSARFNSDMAYRSIGDGSPSAHDYAIGADQAQSEMQHAAERGIAARRAAGQLTPMGLPHMADGSGSASDSDSGSGGDDDSEQPWWKDLVTSTGQGLVNQFLPSPALADGTYRARPTMMADGTGTKLPGIPDLGLPAQSSPKFNPGKLITSPTRVHLNQGDEVVPLSYRAKAKIRPSAALAATTGHHMTPMLHHTYGGIHV